MSVILMLQVFFCLCAAGAVLGMFLPDRLRPASLAWVGSVSALAALWLGGGVLLTGKAVQIPLWNLPELGMLSLQMDRLAALFLVITALVFLPVSIFSSAYLKRYWGRYSLKAFNLSFFGLFASIALILMAGDVLTFLLAWETMSILSYLLVNFDHGEEKNIRAGYLMLTMGEAGTLAAVFALLLLAVNAGSMDFTSIRIAHQGLGGGVRWAVFLLSFFGFGVKAGLVPFNAWLPRAHPAAPGNISALLSGVILNLGIYGIVRTNMDLLPVSLVWPGLAALVIGT
ncbi:MAG TPA: proton-conducting transporter membrane subunit, partial [Kiritimatiellia bacterium]|nr:proton-conducting transporter membrane subunit [Kiritimatiellia bacterium]